MEDINKKDITSFVQIAKAQSSEMSQLYNSNIFKRPNSKKQFLELGAKIQVNALAFKLPKILLDFENKKILDNIFADNEFLEKIQFLEECLYKNGLYAVGVVKKDDKVILRLGKVIEYQKYLNKLVYLKVQIDEIKRNGLNLKIIQEYNILENNQVNVISTYAENQFGQQHKLKDVNYFHSDEINLYDFIPWIIFKNNYKETSEIEQVDPSLFQMLDNCEEMLLRDNYYSSPFIYVQSNFSNGTASNAEAAIFNLDKRVIKSSAYDQAFMSSGASPLSFFQGNSLAQNILQKIDKLIYLIKDAMFFRMNSADFGTKNMHNNEVESLNSNYADYLESKANLREIYYKELIIMIFKILKINLDNDKLKIIVPTSTEYLKSSDALYQINADGVNLNPNSPIIKENKNFDEEN